MADFAGTKRQREAEPAVQDVLHYGRLIIHNDPFKDRAPREEDRAFCALFGCGAHIVLIVWNALKFHELTPAGGTMTHLLWTLLYFKTYPSWKTMSKLTNADPKTLRRWIFGGNDYGSNGFAKAISFLEPYVVRCPPHDLLFWWLAALSCTTFADCLYFFFRFNGEKDTMEILAMIVLPLWMVLTLTSNILVDAFILTSFSRDLDSGMKLLCPLSMVILSG